MATQQDGSRIRGPETQGPKTQRPERDQEQGQQTGRPSYPQRDPLEQPGDQPDIVPDVIADRNQQSLGGTGSRENDPSPRNTGDQIATDQSGINRQSDASRGTPDPK